MTISEVIAEHVVTCRFSALPKPAVLAAKRSFCDTLAVGLGGFSSPGTDAVARMVSQQGGIEECSIWGSDKKLPAASAALLNGVRAAALDYDSLHPHALVHPGVVTVPAAFAVAERVHAFGEEFLAALAIADDLMCRMGLAHQENRGWYLTALYGGIAASIASAKLLKLSVEQTRNALGLAFITASGTQQAMVERSLAKRLQSAVASSSGVQAALLAMEGYDGPLDIVDGQCGFYKMYQQGDANAIVERLGSHFENTSVIHKMYPNCGCSHAVVEGILDLVNQREISTVEIEEVEVVISPYMNRLVGALFDPKENPEVTAQFSVQYAVACCILFRRFTLKELDSRVVLSDDVRALAARVAITVDDHNTGGITPADVVITLKDGGRHSKHIGQLKGYPGNPLAQEALDNKFRACVDYGRPFTCSVDVEGLRVRAAEVEKLDDMAQFFQ